MKTEYEAKFVSVNVDDVRQKLSALGANLEKPMRFMRRVTIDTEDLKKKDALSAAI